MSSQTNPSLRDLEDTFIKVTFEPESQNSKDGSPAEDPFYDPWFERGSGKFQDPASFGSIALRNLYPKHTVVPFGGIDILSFPGAIVKPTYPPDVISSLVFIPLGRQMGHSTGLLASSVRFGLFNVAWDKYDFLLYVARFPQGFGETVVQYLLHEGSEEPCRSLLHTVGIWDNDLHEEIYVFNQGFWNKDSALWSEVQKANWKDVILKDEFKTNLRKDVTGFFSSQELYRSLAIPWKRGIIMYGPPGNGKTVSMKAVMKECDAKGFAPLYVRSFQSWMGEEASMTMCFDKARKMAPCVMVLEDLDSLINDSNRSFFLNQLDGLDDNDGLLIIGSTNHFDQLDPALNNRPSRFDRKYLFDDPDVLERALYARYWQTKLQSNKNIEFPDILVDEVAIATEKFSFAYLKEAFVSALVIFAGQEETTKRDFQTILKGQIRSLRSQLDQSPSVSRCAQTNNASQAPHAIPSSHPQDRNYAVTGRNAQMGRFWDTTTPDTRNYVPMPGALPGSPVVTPNMADGRAVRNANALGRSFIL